MGKLKATVGIAACYHVIMAFVTDLPPADPSCIRVGPIGMAPQQSSMQKALRKVVFWIGRSRPLRRMRPIALVICVSFFLLACPLNEAQSIFPTADVTDFAEAFSAPIVRSKGPDGRDIAEVRTAAGTLRQENFSGKISTTSTDPELYLDKLANQSGAEIIKSRDDVGDDITEFRRGGVIITQRRHSGVVSATIKIEERDGVYQPAILCSQLFLIVDLVELNACYPLSYDDFKQELRHDLDEISKFIAENSLFPLTVGQSRFLTARLMRSYSETLNRASKEMVQQSCQKGEAGRNLRDLFRDAPTPEKLRKSVDDSLRVPRPPIMCSGL